MTFTPVLSTSLAAASEATLAPRYQHDCTCCQFLGSYASERGAVDLYVHATDCATVIARYSSDGPDYSSGSCFSYGQIAALTEARLRAQALGLLTYNVMEAFFHAVPEYPEPYAEMLKALPFTLEYQAALAFEQGDVVRSQGLVRHLLEKRHARKVAHDPDACILASLLEVTGAIERIVSTYRGCPMLETMRTLEPIGEFLWAEFNTTPRVALFMGLATA